MLCIQTDDADTTTYQQYKHQYRNYVLLIHRNIKSVRLGVI